MHNRNLLIIKWIMFVGSTILQSGYDAHGKRSPLLSALQCKFATWQCTALVKPISLSLWCIKLIMPPNPMVLQVNLLPILVFH
jgi:hypothetical protein